MPSALPQRKMPQSNLLALLIMLICSLASVPYDAPPSGPVQWLETGEPTSEVAMSGAGAENRLCGKSQL